MSNNQTPLLQVKDLSVAFRQDGMEKLAVNQNLLQP